VSEDAFNGPVRVTGRPQEGISCVTDSILFESCFIAKQYATKAHPLTNLKTKIGFILFENLHTLEMIRI
jgi:hypothetical protein